MGLYGEDDKNTGGLYGHATDHTSGVGAPAIALATTPLSAVAFVDATGNPYETNKTEYERFAKELSDMERNYPQLKGKVNPINVDQNNMASIKEAIAKVEGLVKEEEGKKLQEAVVGGAMAIAGLGLAAEAAGAAISGKAPASDFMGAEATMAQKKIEEEKRRNNPETEKLLAALTPEQREAHIRHNVTGGEHIPERALFAEIKNNAPDYTKAHKQEKDAGYSGRSLSA